MSIITQNSHGFTKTAIRYNGSSWVAAQADAVANVATAFAVRVDDNRFRLLDIFTMDSYADMTDAAGAALVAATVYYLSASVAGKVTSTAPSVRQEILTTIGTLAKVNIVAYTNALFEPAGSIDIPSGQTYQINNVALAKADVGLGNVTNDAQVKKAASSTSGSLPKWSVTTGDAIVDGYGVVTTLGNPGTDTNIPTEAAVRAALVGSSGDVNGPSSSTDNAVVRFDLTTGKLIKNSLVTIDDSGSVNIPSGQTYKINNVALAKGDVGLGNVTNDAQLKVASNLSDVNDRQTALNNLTAVSAATNEHVLTKDTGTGNLIFKAPTGSALPAGTTNYTLRYSGSAWEATNILQTKTDGVYGSFYETTVTTASSGANRTIDWNTGGVQHVVLDAATVTFTFTAPTGGSKHLKLIILQDATGGRFPIWPASLKFDQGIPITINLAPLGGTIVEMIWDGSASYRCVQPMILEQEMFQDFHVLPTTAGGFLTAAAISSGTTAAISAEAGGGTRVHNGIVRASSYSTTAGSGYRWYSAIDSWRCSGGDVYMCSFKFVDTTTTGNVDMRIGFIDTGVDTDAIVDGIYMNVVRVSGGVPVATGRTSQASTRSSTGTTGTLAMTTWYTAVIYTNYQYSTAYFQVYSDTGALLWSDSLSANLPSGTQVCGPALQFTRSSSATAVVLGYFDSVRVGRCVKWWA